MSLYGVDVLPAKDGRLFIGELNGIRVGMQGFRTVYGDCRVEQKVARMLENAYGPLAIGDGSFEQRAFRRQHPLKACLRFMRYRATGASWVGALRSCLSPSTVFSSDDLLWLKELGAAQTLHEQWSLPACSGGWCYGSQLP